MLEWRLIESNDLRLQVVTTLQSTSTGKHCYQDLCDRQLHLRELVSGGCMPLCELVLFLLLSIIPFGIPFNISVFVFITSFPSLRRLAATEGGPA